MENIILIVVLALIIALASVYVYKAKKSGKKCIGCSEACNQCKLGGSCKMK